MANCTIFRISFCSANLLSKFHSFSFFERSHITVISSCKAIHALSSRLNENFISSTQYNSNDSNRLWRHASKNSFPVCELYLVKYYCNNAPLPEKKPSLLQRFKQMYKDYWYILVPVHLITSAFWFTSFYYMTKSGVDVASLLESVGAGEKLVEKLRNSNSTMGYIAVSCALYKIATPLRYTVTLGGTTVAIKYLRDWGYIKPIPPKDKIKEILHEKKDIFLEKKENLKSRYKEKGFVESMRSKIGSKKNPEDEK